MPTYPANAGGRATQRLALVERQHGRDERALQRLAGALTTRKAVRQRAGASLPRPVFYNSAKIASMSAVFFHLANSLSILGDHLRSTSPGV